MSKFKLYNICPDIFVINLLRRKDRAASVEKQAKEFGFPYTICAAIDAQEIQNDTRLRDGENALLQSYRMVISWARYQNMESVLVFEDDFELVADFNDRLEEFEEVPDDWDLVYLGDNRYSLGAGYIVPEKVTDKVVRLYSSFGAHAILVRNTMYDKIIEGIEKFDKPLDVMYCDLQQHNKAYGFVKPMCKQYDSDSDIIGFNPGYNSKGIFNG